MGAAVVCDVVSGLSLVAAVDSRRVRLDPRRGCLRFCGLDGQQGIRTLPRDDDQLAAALHSLAERRNVAVGAVRRHCTTGRRLLSVRGLRGRRPGGEGAGRLGRGTGRAVGADDDPQRVRAIHASVFHAAGHVPDHRCHRGQAALHSHRASALDLDGGCADGGGTADEARRVVCRPVSIRRGAPSPRPSRLPARGIGLSALVARDLRRYCRGVRLPGGDAGSVRGSHRTAGGLRQRGSFSVGRPIGRSDLGRPEPQADRPGHGEPAPADPVGDLRRHPASPHSAVAQGTHRGRRRRRPLPSCSATLLCTTITSWPCSSP